MRKIIPFVLILATAMGSIAVQEAAAKGGDNGRGGRSGSGESMGSREHVFTHYKNPNNRYRKVLCTVNGTSGMIYDQDLRGWRRVPSCSGRYFFD